MPQPLVSVIVPSLNRRIMLEEAILSVQRQSYARMELVVVDDGSSDETWGWLKTQKVIGVRNEATQGPSAARNRGVEAASGSLIAFLDSDDLFLPGKLERQVELMDSDPEVALCHSNEIWLRHGRELKQQRKHEKRGGWIFEHCLPLCRISPSAVIIRRKIFEQLGGFDEDLEVAEDYEMWLRLTCQYRVGFIDEPLIIKRGGHADQLSEKYGQIEKFRIEGLRRVISAAPLSPPQRQAALSVLRRKCEIYARGCTKRGRFEEAQAILELPKKLG